MGRARKRSPEGMAFTAELLIGGWLNPSNPAHDGEIEAVRERWMECVKTAARYGLSVDTLWTACEDGTADQRRAFAEKGDVLGFARAVITHAECIIRGLREDPRGYVERTIRRAAR